MNDSQGDAWTYEEAVEWWQNMTSYQGWVSCILYDPNELESMVAAMIAEVERLRGELAAAKAETVMLLEMIAGWLCERMKGGEG